jgi:hypothetical protein
MGSRPGSSRGAMSIPKRKRYNRRQRLEAIRQWLQEYSGKKIVRY